jgi:hypothetical protein
VIFWLDIETDRGNILSTESQYADAVGIHGISTILKYKSFFN